MDQIIKDKIGRLISKWKQLLVEAVMTDCLTV